MMRMHGPLVALAVASVGVGGCEFSPVDLEGRACRADSDCITGYACSTEPVCVLVPDAGRPDAGRADAATPDVGRDANGDAFMGLDAFETIDAPDASETIDALETTTDALETMDALDERDASESDAAIEAGHDAFTDDAR
jgi:hypothetical protein